MHESGIEFEIKGTLDSASVERLAAQASVGPASTVVDRYLDTANADLFLNAVFVRVRNNEMLEVKHNEGINGVDHFACNDRQVTFPPSPEDAEAISSFLAFLVYGRHSSKTIDFFALTDFVRIEKVRRSGRIGPVVVSLDEVSGLGVFVEMEVRTQADTTALMRLASAWGVHNLPIGYVELTLRRHHHELYKRGRFVLPEDM